MNDFKKQLNRELEEHIVLSVERKKQLLREINSSEQPKRQRNWRYPIVLTSFAIVAILFISILVQGSSGGSTLTLNNQVHRAESTSLIENNAIMFQTEIAVNWITIVLFVVAILLCMLLMKLKSIENIYSRMVLIVAPFSVIAVLSLGHNYLASLEREDGIGISNLIAYLLIGTEGWSREGFAGIFSISVILLLATILLYPLALILESGHKWRMIVGGSIVGIAIVCSGINLIVDSPVKLTDFSVEEGGSLSMNVANTGYLPIKIKEIRMYDTVQDIKLLATPKESGQKLLEVGLDELAIQPSFVSGTIQQYTLQIEDVHAGEIMEMSYSYFGVPLKKTFVIEGEEGR